MSPTPVLKRGSCPATGLGSGLPSPRSTGLGLWDLQDQLTGETRLLTPTGRADPAIPRETGTHGRGAHTPWPTAHSPKPTAHTTTARGEEAQSWSSPAALQSDLVSKRPSGSARRWVPQGGPGGRCAPPPAPSHQQLPPPVCTGLRPDGVQV